MLYAILDDRATDADFVRYYIGLSGATLEALNERIRQTGKAGDELLEQIIAEALGLPDSEVLSKQPVTEGVDDMQDGLPF